MVVTFFYIVSEVKPGIVGCHEHYYRSLSLSQLSFATFFKHFLQTKHSKLFSLLTENSTATYCTMHAYRNEIVILGEGAKNSCERRRQK